MKKMKFKTPYDYDIDESRCEVLSGKSMTEPDQAMSLREMVERMNRGQLVEVNQSGIYDDDPTLDDEVPIINDLTDVDEYIESIGAKKVNKLNKAKNHDDEEPIPKSDEEDDFKRMKKNKPLSGETEDKK